MGACLCVVGVRPRAWRTRDDRKDGDLGELHEKEGKIDVAENSASSARVGARECVKVEESEGG